MPQSGIYVIINTVNHHCYVGSAVDFHIRELRHFNELRQGKHHSKHLQSAYLKYGEKAFIFRHLEVVPKDKKLLHQREGHWIRFLQPEYNVGKLAATHLGVKRSEETCRVMSEKALARPKPTLETREKLAKAKQDTKRSEEANRKTSKSLEGHEVSEETRRKSSETQKAQWAALSEEEKQAIRDNRMAGRKPITEETRRKQREARLGKKRTIPMTEEEHQIRSESAKAMWEHRKAAKQQLHKQEPLL